MSESTQTATASSLTETVHALETFVTATTEALAAAGAPASARDQVARTGEQLVATVADHADRIDERDDRIEALETELQQERETRAKEAAEDRKRLHEVETRVDAAIDDDAGDMTDTPDPAAGSEPATPRVEPPKTPLEDVIRVPDHLLDESLTANQRRARFVAKDIHEYTRRVPAGQAITSSELRRVLAAGEDTKIYTETVSRVIRFLDDLGGDAVKIRESKRGERVIVFTEAFVERVQAYQSQATAGDNTVVTGGEVSG